MLVDNNAKPFEKPAAGFYPGILVDVVDLGLVPTKFGPKPKVRLVWLLGANDSEGRPFQVMSQLTASLNEKAALYDIVKSILGTAPPVPYDIDNLIGKINTLVIVREKSTDGSKDYANIKAIVPFQGLMPGQYQPAIPQGFQRAKDKSANSGTPLSTAPKPSAQAAVSAPQQAQSASPAPAQQAATPQADVAF